MKSLFTANVFRLLWLASVAFFIADWLFPVSNGLTRLAGIVLLGVVWCGLIALSWRNLYARIALLAISTACAVFLVLPGRKDPGTARLRSAYITGLKRYEGVAYYWGGEGPRGVDCSGLIRRGLIDSLFLRGLGNFDPGLVRRSIQLWWHDCSAQELGEGNRFTTRLFSIPSLNTLDPAKVLPGDLAVTKNGIHILAYTGNAIWIEADPGMARVITVKAPADNVWFQTPMNIVRWKIFTE